MLTQTLAAHKQHFSIPHNGSGVEPHCLKLPNRESFASEGLAVRQFEAMRLHTRSVVRDGKMLFVGSQSLREHELEARRELGVICRDRAAVSGMMKVFEED